MSMSLIRGGPPQLPLFARPRPKPHWTDLSPDVQQKIPRLLTQLLRQHWRQTPGRGPGRGGAR